MWRSRRKPSWPFSRWIIEVGGRPSAPSPLPTAQHPQPRAHSPHDPARHRTPAATTQATRGAAALVRPVSKFEDAAAHLRGRPALPAALETQTPAGSRLFPLRASQPAAPRPLLAMFGAAVWERWAVGPLAIHEKARPKARFPGASALRTRDSGLLKTRYPCLLRRPARFPRPAPRRPRRTSGERRLCGC